MIRRGKSVASKLPQMYQNYRVLAHLW